MELVLAFIITLPTSVLCYLLYSKLERIESLVEELSKPTFLEVVLDESPLLTTVDSPPPPEPIFAPDPNRHQAWVNRKNVPQWESPPPQPPIPVRVSAPLERPQGFV